jgi:hypothetical protein
VRSREAKTTLAALSPSARRTAMSFNAATLFVAATTLPAVDVTLEVGAALGALRFPRATVPLAGAITADDATSAVSAAANESKLVWSELGARSSRPAAMSARRSWARCSVSVSRLMTTSGTRDEPECE